MINAKQIYNTLLNDERITTLVKNVVDAYPSKIINFPCVIFLDADQNDEEFADNLPTVDKLGVEIHIFTKAVGTYKTTSEIGIAVANVMKENFYACTGNREVPDVNDTIRHRVMYFTREYFS